MKTTVVNLYGGAGIGKSTISAFLFSELKSMNYEAEYVNEFAKELIWEKRNETFEDEVYIFGKQNHKLFRVNGKVEVVITDRPLLITNIFNEDNPELCNLCLKTYNQYNNCNIFLKRDVSYNPNGRNETEEEAKKNDEKIFKLLKDNNIDFTIFKSTDKEGILDYIKKTVLKIDSNPKDWAVKNSESRTLGSISSINKPTEVNFTYEAWDKLHKEFVKTLKENERLKIIEKEYLRLKREQFLQNSREITSRYSENDNIALLSNEINNTETKDKKTFNIGKIGNFIKK